MPRAETSLKCFVYAVLILCVGFARAQENTETSPSVTLQYDNWTKGRVSGRENVLVVTSSEPKLRQKCRVSSISDDELVCAGRHHKTVTFQKDDIVALLQPAHRDQSKLPLFLGLFAGGGGMVYAAVVIASVSTPLIAVAIPLALVGSVFGIGSVAILIGDDVSQPESVLYLRPGEKLQFALHQ